MFLSLCLGGVTWRVRGREGEWGSGIMDKGAYVMASAWSFSSPPSLEPGTMSRSTARFSRTLTMVACVCGVLV